MKWKNRWNAILCAMIRGFACRFDAAEPCCCCSHPIHTHINGMFGYRVDSQGRTMKPIYNWQLRQKRQGAKDEANEAFQWNFLDRIDIKSTTINNNANTWNVARYSTVVYYILWPRQNISATAIVVEPNDIIWFKDRGASTHTSMRYEYIWQAWKSVLMMCWKLWNSNHVHHLSSIAPK